MESKQKNIIRKQVIDLHYNGRKDGFGLQTEISEWCHRSLLPKIEEVLDKIDTGEIHARIDKLDLDINIDAKGDWLSSLSKEITMQLRKKIAGSLFQQNKADGISILTGQQHFFEAFVFFLQKGYLPWWYEAKPAVAFFEELGKFAQSDIKAEERNIIFTLVKEETVMQRFIQQVPHEDFFLMTKKILRLDGPKFETLIENVKKFAYTSAVKEDKIILPAFKKAILIHIDTKSPEEFIEKVAQSFTGFVADEGLFHLQQLQAHRFISEELKKATERMSLRLAEKTKEKETDVAEENTAAVLPKTPVSPEPVLQPDSKEGIYVGNAGLVIAAPFFLSFFKKINLADEGVILDINSAVGLVHFLATGNEGAAEFELGLAKILCGLSMETPVETGLTFSEEQRTEANELLLSVIEYWNILGETSVAGLRESFLQRNGKLTFDGKSWLLQVEQKPFDMLLQHLPWNISMIQLPWMKYMLKTEWVF
jgi:hypothetical protein